MRLRFAIPVSGGLGIAGILLIAQALVVGHFPANQAGVSFGSLGKNFLISGMVGNGPAHSGKVRELSGEVGKKWFWCGKVRKGSD